MTKLNLSASIDNLPMVGPTYAKRLEKLEIFTIEDLLHHFPFRYEDASTILPIAAVTADMRATIKGSVVSAKNIRTKRGKQMQKATIADESGSIEVTWFSQPYLVKTLKAADQIQLSGKVSIFRNQLSMTSPEYEILKEGKETLHTGGLIPVYPETYGVSSKWLRSRISPVIKDIVDQISDWLPESIKEKEKLVNLPTAILHAHFPENQNQLDQAIKRLAFDELFLLQLASQKRKHDWSHKKLSHPLTINSQSTSKFIKSLPFTLTKAQMRSKNEILKDLGKEKPMNRLLQGDVGSGKTVVAAMAMHICYENGFKSILMAPTGILANQHFDTLKNLLEPLGLKVALVTSSTKTQKDDHLDQIADVFVGTQALLHRQLPKNIGLLVVDEQHRFGVEQRSKLLEGRNTPHLLAMTATPIPRTIALTIYSELDLSIIDEMPIGRKKVKTWVVADHKREKAYNWVRKHIKKDRVQAFIVCPFIQESETEKFAQVKAVETEYKNLKKLVFTKLKLDLLHGKMGSKQKDDALDKFKNKKTHILVSTPVIEVGIDIPNANIMIIEAAERFGLAQLHQLRGRVGRGDKQSYCFLFTSNKQSEDSARLKALENHHSGFKLAQIDLDLRGPGEMYGLKQHGYQKLRFASFSDQKLIHTTHNHAKDLIENSPSLSEHKSLNEKLTTLMTKKIKPN